MTTVIRHSTNPFVKDLVINKKAKQVKVSTLNKDRNILINQETGEIRGTHVVTYKQVDDAEFVKLFAANIGLTFDLNAAGIKAFTVLIHVVQYSAIERDLVLLDSYTLEEFLKTNPDKKLSTATFHRGLNDLEKAQIIAKATRKGYYYINPNFVFNGNRIAFTTAIQRKNKGDEHQLNLID